MYVENEPSFKRNKPNLNDLPDELYIIETSDNSSWFKSNEIILFRKTKVPSGGDRTGWKKIGYQ